MENKCAKCSNELVNNFETVNCNGACNKKYHYKCIGFTAPNLKFLNEHHNVKYICDDCENRPVSVLNKTIQNIFNYICIFDERFKRQESNSNQLFKELEDMRGIMQANVQSMTSVDVNKSNDTPTFAEKVKERSHPVVIVKPKSKQNSQDTRAKLAEKFPNPQAVNISNVKDIPNGGLAINCKNSSESIKLQEEASKHLGDDYTVIIPVVKKPKIKLCGMNEMFSADEMCERIKEQNYELSNCDINVISVFENKKRHTYDAIVELDDEHFDKVMQSKKILIGWNSCHIEEYINVKRCFKCCGYNHKSNDCKNKLSCLKCGGEHKINECKADHFKCVNCSVVVNKWRVKLDTNHPANSKQCPVYKKKINSMQNRCKKD